VAGTDVLGLLDQTDGVDLGAGTDAEIDDCPLQLDGSRQLKC
jgi:hypothetical protein